MSIVNSTFLIFPKYLPVVTFQFLEEAKRMTGVNFHDQMTKFFTADIVEKILADKSAVRTILEEAKQSNVNSNCVVFMTYINSFKYNTVDWLLLKPFWSPFAKQCETYCDDRVFL